MTASDGDLIGVEAVDAFIGGYLAEFLDGRTALFPDRIRAGLAAALPHLAAACDALRAAGPAPTRSHQPTPERRPTAATGALNDAPQQNPNPNATDQEDRPHA